MSHLILDDALCLATPLTRLAARSTLPQEGAEPVAHLLLDIGVVSGA